jgi:uncharacterized protein (TIGR02270 family)
MEFSGRSSFSRAIDYAVYGESLCPTCNIMAILSVVHSLEDQATLLWLARFDAMAAPHYRLRQLARLDTRLDAHLDGLRIAGDPGWDIAARELAWKEPGEVFVAAVLAFESGSRERIEAVLAVATPDRGLSRGVISALGWLELEQARPHIEALIRATDPSHRRIGLRAAAVHRWSPGSAFEAALRGDEPTLIAAAARAAGELADAQLTSLCQPHLQARDLECRFWASWSLAMAGNRGSLPFLQEVAASQSVRALAAFDAAARRLSLEEAHAWWRGLTARPESLRTAILLAGRLGDPELVPWLIDQMAVPEFARPAGEAFTFIVGVDLAFQDLEADPPEGFEAGPTEDPEDSNVAMDADENLPWPNPVLVRKWWDQNRSSLRGGVRHLLGQPLAPVSLQQALRHGKQRQRAAAALELYLLEPERHLFEVRAPAFRQRKVLSA